MMDHGHSIQRAVALRWDSEEMLAPSVVASGRGEIAQRILDLARENGIPISEDSDVMELLAFTEVGDEIPVELYTAIAELLSYLFRLNANLAS